MEQYRHDLEHTYSIIGADIQHRHRDVSNTPSNLQTASDGCRIEHVVSRDTTNRLRTPSLSYPATSNPSTPMEYGPEGTQTPGLSSYNAAMMMCRVPHTATQQTVFDKQQFTPRQHEGMEMMSLDVASTYFASDATGAVAPSLQAAGQGSSASSNAYKHQNPGIGYSSSMSELQQQSSGANQGTSEGRDVSSDDTIAMTWSRYQRQLGTVFQDVRDEHLERASKTLLDISNWLLPQVSQLGTSNQRHHLKPNPQLIANGAVGLHQDDANLHEERLKLWGEFNQSWLALAFKQKCLMTVGRQISGSQRRMTKANVQTLGNELVRLCDEVERHGLVDYQYGVAEEQILDELLECLVLFDKEEQSRDTTSTHPLSSMTGTITVGEIVVGNTYPPSKFNPRPHSALSSTFNSYYH